MAGLLEHKDIVKSEIKRVQRELNDVIYFHERILEKI